MINILMPLKLICGEQASLDIFSLIPQQLDNVLIVTGAHPERYNEQINPIMDKKNVHIIKVPKEPCLEGLTEMANSLEMFSPNVIISIGGGSVIDIAKALSLLLRQSGKISDYFDLNKDTKEIQGNALFHICVPTTSGTGSETTKNSVINIKSKKIKISLRDERLIPKIVILDYNLTKTLPLDVRMNTTMDTLVQLVESYASPLGNSFSRMYASEGIRLMSEILDQFKNRSFDKKFRQNMAMASTLSGMALTNSKLGAVHGIAGVIGGYYDIPHGQLCSIFFLPVIKQNISISKNDNVLKNYKDIFNLLFSGNNQTLECLIEQLDEFISIVTIPQNIRKRLADLPVNEISNKVLKSSSYKGNPVELPLSDLNHLILGIVEGSIFKQETP